jgi:hypothetical protein
VSLTPAKDLVLPAPLSRELAVDATAYLDDLGDTIRAVAGDGERLLTVSLGRGYPEPEIAEAVWSAVREAGYYVGDGARGGKIIRW